MFCPNCGKEYQENQNFCRFCGTKLNENTENVTEKKLENEKTVSEQQDNVQKTEIQPENTTVDLTIKNQTEETTEEQTENEKSLETTPDEEINEQDEEEPETLKEEVNDFFTELKNSLIIETPEGKKLTPSAITLLVVLFLFIVFMGNLLWSINDAIQINPSMTNENALMNIPNDNEDGAYTQTPEPTEEEENTEEEQQEENQEEQTYAEQPQPIEEEAPIVPIEEVRQREQQFPEPEIPAPQEFTDAAEH